MRKTPYTSAGIKRLRCFRGCGRQAHSQWQVCADNNIYRPLCKECDIELNALVLDFMNYPNASTLMEEYKKRADTSHR